MPPRSLTLLALALATCVLMVQARIVIGGETWDDERYHTEVAPPRLAAADAIAHGELPQWWEGTALGVPLLGGPSHGAAAPAVWLARSPYALDLVMVLHVMWLALGVAMLARRRSSALGAVVAGMLVATTGVVASSVVRGALPALAHLPWIALCATMLGEKRRAAVALGALIGAVALAGELGVLADALVIAIALGARRQAIGRLAVAIGCGLAIGCIQWLPAALALGAAAGAQVHGLGLARIIELVAAGSFGSSDPARAVAAIAGTDAWAPSLYVGAPLIALASIERLDRRMLIAFGVLALLAIVVGQGGWPAWLGAPELHVAALACLAGARAGRGVDALVAGERRAIIVLCAAGVVSAIALAAVAAVRAMHPSVAALDRALFDAAVALACLAGATAIAWRAPARLAVVAVLLVVAPNVVAIPSLVPAATRTAEPAWGAAARGVAPPRRVFRPAVMPDAPTGLGEQLATFGGSSGSPWGIASARSDDPARPAIHDRAWLAAAHVGGAMLDRFGIALAIVPSALVDAQHFQELARRGKWSLVRYPAAAPASVMFEWQWTKDREQALVRAFPPGATRGLGRGRLVLTGTGALPDEDLEVAPVPCTIERWDPGAIELGCRADADGYAVVSSTAAAGWDVDVDGHASDWVLADAMRRAVAIPPGEHQVRWTYRAPGLRLGLALGALGVVGLAILWLALSRRESGRARSRDP